MVHTVDGCVLKIANNERTEGVFTMVHTVDGCMLKIAKQRANVVLNKVGGTCGS